MHLSKSNLSIAYSISIGIGIGIGSLDHWIIGSLDMHTSKKALLSLLILLISIMHTINNKYPRGSWILVWRAEGSPGSGT